MWKSFNLLQNNMSKLNTAFTVQPKPTNFFTKKPIEIPTVQQVITSTQTNTAVENKKTER